MSNEANNQLWVLTKNQLDDLRQQELEIVETKPTKVREVVLNILTNIYPKYVKIVQNLGICFDQMIQIQRREYVRRFFDAANARLMDLRRDIVSLELSELIYMDDKLIQWKLIPQDIDIMTPAHFMHEARDENLQELYNKICAGERIYDPPLEVIEEEDGEEVEEVAPPPKKKMIIMDDEEDEENKPVPVVCLPHEDPNIPEAKRAQLKILYEYNCKIQLIQNYERARRGRAALIIHRQFIEMKRAGKRYPKPPPKDVLDKYATKIEAYWRGYRARKIVKVEEEERKLMIGMTKPSWRSSKSTERNAEVQQHRRDVRRKYEKELAEFGETERVRILAIRGPGIFEDISDEILQWFTEWYNVTGQWDLFPEIEDGGTILVVTGQSKTIAEWQAEELHRQWLAERYAADPTLKLKDAEEAKKAKEAEKARKIAEKKRKKELAAQRAQEPNPPWEFQLSPAVVEMAEIEKGYHNLFEFRSIEDNVDQLPYTDFVTEQKYAEISLEIRKQVDELMRLELRVLRAALDRDRAALKLGPTPVPKAPKAKKKKIPKDMTADRTTEDLFQELVDNGIIRTYPKASLNDFKGDYSYNALEFRREFKDPPPCLQDIRHVIMTNIILPLGSKMAVRSPGVLIAGPRQCGKDLLVNAICTESGAVMFDITPRITVGKYPGKKGLKMLVHLLVKMGRILQPSIIYMDGAEKPFYTKVPPAEAQNDPKLLKKVLFASIIKVLKADDQIIVVGTSREPWAGSLRPMTKVYKRIIVLPRLEYASLYLIWYEWLMTYHLVDRNFDCSSLAKVTVGYPLPYLRECFDQVMTPERVIRLALQPLDASEILQVVLAGGVSPVTDQEFALYYNWYLKTPMGFKKNERLEGIKLELLREAKKNAAANKK